MIKLLEHTRRPDVSFSRCGTIRIAANVARMLSLRPGDVLNICLDAGEYLLCATRFDDPVGRWQAQCKPTNKGGWNYIAYSASLCRAFLICLGLNATEKVSFAVGKPFERNGIVYVPIITKSPL